MNNSSDNCVNRFGYDLSTFWLNAQGELLEIADMETSHIKNCIRMLITFLSDEISDESDSARLISLTSMINELINRNTGYSEIPVNNISSNTFLTTDDFLIFSPYL